MHSMALSSPEDTVYQYFLSIPGGSISSAFSSLMLPEPEEGWFRGPAYVWKPHSHSLIVSLWINSCHSDEGCEYLNTDI